MKRMLAGALAALAVFSPAHAHIVFAEPEAAPGSYYVGVLRVGHGCEGAPTRSVRVEIPESVLIARPQPKPGWSLDIERAPLAAPVASEGAMITERVAAVTWRGELPADQFDQFAILMKLPAGPGPLYFPTVQTCTQGDRRWTDIPAPGQAWREAPNPAPVLRLAAPAATEAHEHR